MTRNGMIRVILQARFVDSFQKYLGQQEMFFNKTGYERIFCNGKKDIHANG
jgi:hypothetical protein